MNASIEANLMPKELAPSACIVCGLPMTQITRSTYQWVYLAGAIPLGSMACGMNCALVALSMLARGKRADGKENRTGEEGD